MTDTLTFLADCIRSCRRCPLHLNRRNAVPGAGPPTARAVLVAERPGYREDQYGVPLIGDSGALFDQVLDGVGLRRSDFFLTNVLKCLPPKTDAGGNDYQVSLQEVETCEAWLAQQLAEIRPRVLVVCGNLAISRYFPGERIGKVHGTPRVVWVPWSEQPQGLIVIPTYHPASALHQEQYLAPLRKDFQVVARLLDDIL